MSVTETVAAASPAVSATEVSSQPSQSPSAVEDARRIYLGNLPRSVKPEDITGFLKGYTVENDEPAVPATVPKEDKPAEVSKKTKAKSTRPRIRRERAPDNISPTDSIFVSNVSNRTTKEDLAIFFKDLNPEWTHISFKRATKDGRSFTQFFGFAKFKDTDTQQKAIAEFNGKKLGNRTIYVSAVTGIKKKNDESEASSKTGESKTVEATKETKEPKKKEAKELKQPTDNKESKETKAVNDDKNVSSNEVKVATQSTPSTTQP